MARYYSMYVVVFCPATRHACMQKHSADHMAENAQQFFFLGKECTADEVATEPTFIAGRSVWVATEPIVITFRYQFLASKSENK